MIQITEEDALRYHEQRHPGKIEIMPTKPYSTQRDLSLAYSPGVAWPCLKISADPADTYKYTGKGNLVAIISNGTAVLGLGNIGPEAAKPVMEGKSLLFKVFAGIDAFDLEIDQTDPQKIVEIIRALQPTFGAINLEDIKAPECFVIEERLRDTLSIPVMHDDQHGTAVIAGAALLNALELQHKKISDIRLVVNGAGAAAYACTRFFISLGIDRRNIIMCDSKGVIRTDRSTPLNDQKREFAIESGPHTLAEAINGADVFLGLSVKGILTPEMVRSMAPRPVILALANPDPEIPYEVAVSVRPDVIMATGRSDCPNQVNNALGFPYIFRGALDSGAVCINEEMKIAACKAIASLAHKAVPEVVEQAYGDRFTFGPGYILPKPLDPRLLTDVSAQVAHAAQESGVARRPIKDWEKYREHLLQTSIRDRRMMSCLDLL